LPGRRGGVGSDRGSELRQRGLRAALSLRDSNNRGMGEKGGGSFRFGPGFRFPSVVPRALEMRGCMRTSLHATLPEPHRGLPRLVQWPFAWSDQVNTLGLFRYLHQGCGMFGLTATASVVNFTPLPAPLDLLLMSPLLFVRRYESCRPGWTLLASASTQSRGGTAG